MNKSRLPRRVRLGNCAPIIALILIGGLFVPVATGQMRSRNQTPATSQSQIQEKTASVTQSAELGESLASTDSFVVDAGLRLQWSASQSRQWNIQLSIAADDPGTFSQLENHCQNAASVNRFTIAADGRSVVFSSREQMEQGALQIRFSGNSTSRLIVQSRELKSSGSDPGVASDDVASADKNTITIENLLHGSEFSIVDDANPTKPTLTLRRQDDDELAVKFSEGSVYRDCGDAFTIVVQTNAFFKMRSRNLSLKYQLIRVQDGEQVAESDYSIAVDQNGNSAALEITGKAPDRDGVYEIRCLGFENDDAIWSRLRGSTEALAKSHSVMIVQSALDVDSPIKQSQRPLLSWDSIGQVRPAQKPEWELKKWWPGNFQKPSIGKAYGASDTARSGGLAQAKHGDEVVSLLDPKSTYSTRLPRLQPNQPHRLTFRYPAGQRLNLQIQLSQQKAMDRPSQTFVLSDSPSVGDDVRYRTQSVLYYPTQREQFVTLTNNSDNQVMSFESIEIFAGSEVRTSSPPSDSTAESSASSLKAQDHLMRDEHRTALLHLNDFEWFERLVYEQQSQTDNRFHPDSIAADRLVTATKRLAQYMSMAGYNAVSIPGNAGGRTGYATREFVPLRSQTPFASRQILTVLRLMNRRDLRVYVGVDPSDVPGLTVPCIDPTSQKRLFRWLTDLDQQCLSEKSYAGLVISPAGKRNSADYSALTPVDVKRFIDETVFDDSDKPPANANHHQLHSWATLTARSDLIAWCESEALATYDRVASEIRGQVLLTGNQWSHQSDSDKRLVVVRAFDGKSTSGDSGADQNTTARHSVSHNAMVPAVDIGSYADLAQFDATAASGRSMTGRLVDTVQRANPQWVIVSEKNLSLRWDDALASMLQDFASMPTQKWGDIPAVQSGEEQAPSMQTTTVRYVHSGGETAMIVSNVAPWKAQVTIQCQTTLPWQSTALPSDFRSDGASMKFSVAPESLLILRAKNDSPANPVHSWMAGISGGPQTLSLIKHQVTTVVERIGTLSQPPCYTVLSNGGFELKNRFEQSNHAALAGWMHTQHPADAVRIDAVEASAGRQSVVLANGAANSGRTWIVSEQFKPPQSGRLAVSLALRGELVPGDQTKQKIQVSIEATHDGEPIRHSQIVEINRDGKWQPRHTVLEADNVSSQTVDSIRLTIDSLSRGRVWIDDVQLHDHFPMANERRELQDKAFMAVQGLQHGSLTSASSLLQNYWAQQLLATSGSASGTNTPSFPRSALDSIPGRSWAASPTTRSAKPAGVAKSSSTPPIAGRFRRATPGKGKPPSVAERIKDWLPRPLRF
ncbi:hypothetical protein [Planctomycetes bacterium K23_9]